MHVPSERLVVGFTLGPGVENGTKSRCLSEASDIGRSSEVAVRVAFTGGEFFVLHDEGRFARVLGGDPPEFSYNVRDSDSRTEWSYGGASLRQGRRGGVKSRSFG
jgi:hypothetical protein